MMHGRGKSDSAIVAVKPANKAEHPAEQSAVEATAAEPVERRAETKGNAGQQSTCRTQSRASVSQALERIRQTFAACAPALVTRLSGSESGTCFAGPHSPWSPPFAPPTPRRIASLCSPASQLSGRRRRARLLSR